MSLIDLIQKIETPESVITVDGIRYRVVGKSGLDSGGIAMACEQSNKKRKQAGLKRISLDYFYLAECVSQVDTGETLTAEQWANVHRKHTAPIVVEVMRNNGLDDQDIERDPKD